MINAKPNENFLIFSNIVGPISTRKNHTKEVNSFLKTTRYSSILCPLTTAVNIMKTFNEMPEHTRLNIICLFTSFNGLNTGFNDRHISVGVFRKVNEPGSVIECK